MSKKNNSVALVSTLFIISSSAAATADQIDEQHSQFLSEVAIAKNEGKISSKQAAKLDRELREFSKLKRQLREQHGDVLSADDRLKLNQTLNKSRQDFDTMANSKMPPATSKSTLDKKTASHTIAN